MSYRLLINEFFSKLLSVMSQYRAWSFMNEQIRDLGFSLLLGVLLLAAPYARAELYKWVDEAGNVVYTDKPPPDAKVEVIPPPPPVDSESALKALEESQLKLDERREQRLKNAEEQRELLEQEASARRACEEARGAGQAADRRAAI